METLARLTPLTDSEVIESVTALREEQRVLDARRIRAAGELAHRSLETLGADGIAQRAGFSKPGGFLAEIWHITVGEAIRLCAVGLATRQGSALDGSSLPARFPFVARAVEELGIGLDSAAVIVRELDSAARARSVESRLVAEKTLVELCEGFTVREVQVLARQMRDRLDQDGAEPRDEHHRTCRALTIFTTPDGMMRLDWLMPPEVGGLVEAGIDAIVSNQLRQAREPVAMPDDRILPQLRSDAAQQVFHHAATCNSPHGVLPPRPRSSPLHWAKRARSSI
jgi:hypothetical protein